MPEGRWSYPEPKSMQHSIQKQMKSIPLNLLKNGAGWGSGRYGCVVLGFQRNNTAQKGVEFWWRGVSQMWVGRKKMWLANKRGKHVLSLF